MLNKPDISLIISQNTLTSLWLMMLSDSWLLPSPMLLSSMYEEEKVFYFFCRETVTCLKTNRSIFIFLYKDLKIVSSLLWLSVLHCHLQHEHHQCLIPLPFLCQNKKIYMNSFKFLHSVTKKMPFSRIETQLFCFIETLL